MDRPHDFDGALALLRRQYRDDAAEYIEWLEEQNGE